jgi:shikimate dehydrogenase
MSTNIGPHQNHHVVGLVGGGIGTSLSPPLHETEADHLGVRYVYQLIDIDELEFEPIDVGGLLEEARRMGFSGLNITYPCKQVVLGFLDELSPEAEALGAVNTVVFSDGKMIGYNTDELGFRESFVDGLPGVAANKVVLIGAGGAGTAVAHAILTLGVEALAIFDTEQERAVELAKSLSRRFGLASIESVELESLAEVIADADGIIHATPTGMAARPGLPLPVALLRRELWVADIVYRPLETELLAYARSLGCRTLDGGGMVVIQAAESFALFTGIQPDRGRMFRHFAELVDAEASDVAVLDST